MLNDKREIKGTMIYTNEIKYEGQWRNYKKMEKEYLHLPFILIANIK